MNPVVHFELPYKVGERISHFYTSVFGWQLTNLGEDSGHYILAKTAVSDAKPGFPAGAIDGGFYLTKDDFPMQYPSIVIGVEDITESIRKIEKFGGTVLGTPIDISGFGRYVAFVDTEGNRLSMIQPSNM